MAFDERCRRPLPATTAFFSMADSAVSKQSRPGRAASKKRREATVSTETEKKLARAARSAQRLAQLSDVSRDDSTLDLFPDDPTRATLEAMNIDIRQGTLHGFELPDVVLAAVGALDASAEGASPDARAARRAPRAATAEEPGATPAQLGALLGMEPPAVAGADASQASLIAHSAADDKAPASPLTPAMAAATVARSVTALRQAAERSTASADSAATGMSGADGKRSQALAFSEAEESATASRADAPEASAGDARSALAAPGAEPTLPGGAASSAPADARAGRKGAPANLRGSEEVARPPTGAAAAQMPTSETVDAAGRAVSASAGEIPALTADAAVPPARLSASASAGQTSPSATAGPAGQVVKPSASAAAAETLSSTMAPTAPELDRARATAFADTVDALYGVIADQRRAASDHSRRMKWMLSIVVGALLMTVAIGITQTLLLMRLTRETTAQQHRMQDMMQNQQAAMASLLDTQMAVANTAAARAAAPESAPAPTNPQQAAAAPASANGKRAVRAQHSHKPKTANARQ